MNIDPKILAYNLAPLNEGTDAGKLYRALSGYTPGYTSFVSIWGANGHFKLDTFFVGKLGLKNKADYLAFRDMLKDHLRFFAAQQREMAARYKRPGGDASAQSSRARFAQLITVLIEIRRAGKVWSAAEAAATEPALCADTSIVAPDQVTGTAAVT